MSWITEAQDGVVLKLRVVARASRNGVGEVVEDELKVRIQTAPVDGKANKALIKLLAKTLHVPAGNITIVSGLTGRRKRVAIAGLTADAAGRLLLPSSRS